MYRLCLSPWISIVSLVVFAGCADTSRLNTELMSTQAELRHLKQDCSANEKKIADLQSENDLLKRRAAEAARERDAAIKKLDNFEKRHVLLEARYNDLRRNHQQLRNWAKELVEGYGPGIWTWSARLDLPLYRKPADSATVRGLLDELNEARTYVQAYERDVEELTYVFAKTGQIENTASSGAELTLSSVKSTYDRAYDLCLYKLDRMSNGWITASNFLISIVMLVVTILFWMEFR